ncbi:MAG: tyrosine phenol-lyase [Planctomycetes bacterium]|nr:tyrosine phenol-lyase [Planctomycetota bacterium]
MPKEGRFHTLIEPFRIKVVEPIRLTTRAKRRGWLEAAGYNPFLLHADQVLIDLLTDSGTSAMSQDQWAGVMRGDESYAGARSWFTFRDTVREITGFEHVIPVHQGRAAERILFSTTVKPGQRVLNNTHFDTTRASVEAAGGTAVDLPCAEASDLESEYPFKGNLDLGRTRAELETHGRDGIALVMITVTNNSGGGQPASLENVRAASELAHEFGVPFYLDACRFAENAWFIKQREPGQQDRAVEAIAGDLFEAADGCTFSAKKDALANIGGFLATRDPDLASRERNLLILTEGFPTYGGMAGRDLEAVAQGLREVLDEDYLDYRVGSVAYVHARARAHDVPLLCPAGGHAVYIDARRFLPHVPFEELPGIAVAGALYEDGGIRGVEIGTCMFGSTDPETGREKPHVQDLVRLAVPRRVYTQSHMDFVVEVLAHTHARREDIGGLAFVHQQAPLRHFTARFRRL